MLIPLDGKSKVCSRWENRRLREEQDR